MIACFKIIPGKVIDNTAFANCNTFNSNEHVFIQISTSTACIIWNKIE